MSSVVVTGTGLLTAAGIGHDGLERALATGHSFVGTRANGLRCSDVSPEYLFWPAAPDWQAMREYAGKASQLAVTACNQALDRALKDAGPCDTERAATVVVTGDDWTEQAAFDSAIARAASRGDEARALFTVLDDQFLLRTFRWGVGFAIGSLTAFQGPSVGVDFPSFGGLAGLRHAMDLIDSGEVDTVMLVGVDTIARLDVVASLERTAHDSGQPAPCFAQGAAALMLERSSCAAARGARPLARVADCQLSLADSLELSNAQATRGVAEGTKFSAVQALGTSFSAGSLVDLCLATEWLSRENGAGRSGAAHTVATETFWAHGTGCAVLRSIDDERGRS